MKVILLEDVKKQGKKGQIINVKDGYGNYLITNKLAVLETKGSKKVLDEQNKKAKEEELQNLKNCQQLKKEIEKQTLSFKVNTGKDEKVFGSISSKQIVSKLKEKNINIDKRKINIDTPINTLGTTTVNINLHKEVVAKLKIRLEKE